MRKLVISAFALAAMTSFAMAAEPVKLTSSQMDLVAAGNPCSKFFGKCRITQVNVAKQNAYASAFLGTAIASNVAVQSNNVSGGDD
jgi:hypothetical protein